MADIELVIKIPEDVYERCRKYELHCGEAEILEGAVATGIPLSKGHGRLIDEDYLMPDYEYEDEDKISYAVSVEQILGTPAIIEADSKPCDDYDLVYCEGRDCSECSYSRK